LKTTNQLDQARTGGPLAGYSLNQLNALGRAHFVHVVGPVFEHSPWIAEQTWARRPFNSVHALHRALCETVLAADDAGKLTLIQAHPDLAGKAAKTGTLTQASTREQAGSGLAKLTREEAALFDQLNRAYRRKFGFPFVICARRNRKEAVLAGFQRRLPHSRSQEIQAALAEIFQIAELRLNDLIAS
jgi:2-oxo-4-hydroxy-4-carboxy-5-ureidoimidazoline decarboxylase